MTTTLRHAQTTLLELRMFCAGSTVVLCMLAGKWDVAADISCSIHVSNVVIVLCGLNGAQSVVLPGRNVLVLFAPTTTRDDV